MKKKIILCVCMVFLFIGAYAGNFNKEIKSISKTQQNERFELFRITGSYTSKCGVKWNFIVNTNNPFSIADRINALVEKSNKACGTDATLVTNFSERFDSEQVILDVHKVAIEP